MKEVWIKINDFNDRKNAICAFASAGYKVRTSVERKRGQILDNYWVIFEIDETNIKPISTKSDE